MYLINGQWQTTLPANDRAVQFGDGCFTTAAISAGNTKFIDQHIRRLQLACETLMLPFAEWALLADEMQQLASRESQAVLKVIISRGAGGRGYSAAHCHQPTRILSVSPYPSTYAAWREQGITLALSPICLGVNPALAGIKHLNRLEQVLIRTHLEQTPAEEALVLDSEGWLTECCAANLFWRKGNVVFTPFVDRAGVNGTMRQHMIACLAGSGWQLREVRERVETLADADEVLICNALMPVVPVRQAQNWQYTSRELYHFLAPLCE
ncbi:aminodeoxychorismate lyase [Enterobacteriaceae bacterium H11S18]|uniref:aminodeoxychorismate lyase n=1 Tax=Dryocola clanedunensis TaxID=2925396 RepID=UPI0022F08D98|nr:aminodeoxychorismate lyase [Dryocola clanedunensis]MCT4706130.1 aminodeoxychorismate lyase [Dryocola clanedunensis]MCT4712877.1 aminodeoxychorismate lyase [Dryocola clanedunensis]